MVYIKYFATEQEKEACTETRQYIAYTEDSEKSYIHDKEVFCKLYQQDGSVVEIEGSGELTTAMTSAYKATTVSADIGKLCTSIGNNAFANCSGLSSITIGSGVTNINNYAFRYCSGLTSITIPDSVTSVGSSAFQGCSGLTCITIGNGVKTIGAYAFYDCKSLTNITIGSGVTSIGSYAFKGCTSLPIEGNIRYADTCAISATSQTLITYNIKEGTRFICQEAFKNCKKCTSITIPNSVIFIGSHAFDSCSGLTSVTIPDSVTSIGTYAFSGCTALSSVTIGSGVTSIGSSAFDSCSGLTSITSLATLAPTIATNTFRNVKSGGTLTVPQGSTGYDTWMQNANYYLGLYNWTKVEQ